ncbi:hypothetical protein V8E53_004958 [Lactarius tabidus]
MGPPSDPNPSLEELNQQAVQDDLDGEKETVAVDEGNTNLMELLSTVNEVSKGVSDGTHAEYRRLISQCEEFLDQRELVPRGQFFSNRPHKYAPQLIVVWIMKECDEINLDGSKRPSDEVRATYGTAQKMRAAMTYAFGRLHGLGTMHWQCSTFDGSMVGNPSVSESVSRYMLSLHRRKVQAGETATSARAISSETLKRLYIFNHLPENWDLKKYSPGSKNKAGDQWGGPCARRLLGLAYTLAFLCLLRVDEVLNIQSQDLIVLGTTGKQLKLTLPYRKTSQLGAIKPFILHEQPEEFAHLCPIRAYGEWLKVSKITHGYIFHKIASGDRILLNNQRMSAEFFLEMFRNNLIDINIDPAAYGTHSFRRGGCQYFSVERRYSLRDICDWGGWSSEFTHLTIVKYLISWKDDPSHSRDEFLNMNRAPAVNCSACGRTCHCS